jgi:hypothetical protein
VKLTELWFTIKDGVFGAAGGAVLTSRSSARAEPAAYESVRRLYLNARIDYCDGAWSIARSKPGIERPALRLHFHNNQGRITPTFPVAFKVST